MSARAPTLTGFGKRTGKRTAETYQGDSVKMSMAMALLNARRERPSKRQSGGCRTSDEAVRQTFLPVPHPVPGFLDEYCAVVSKLDPATFIAGRHQSGRWLCDWEGDSRYRWEAIGNWVEDCQDSRRTVSNFPKRIALARNEKFLLPRCLFTNDILCLFISPQAEKHGLTQLVVGSPLGELDLGDQHRLDPMASPHDCSGNALAPPPGLSLAGLQKNKSRI
jgi:hypothetical protein